MTPKTPCISYLRVSTKRQGRSGLGLEAQRAAVETFLRSGECAELLAEYREKESGKVDARPVLREALEHAKNTGATLVVAKLDRLGRRTAHILTLIDDAGVPVRIADHPHASRDMVGFMAVMAESEGRRISERTRDALAQARRRGTELGGRRSTTWDRGDEGPEEAAARSAAVRRARADEWAEGLRRVVEELRAEGRTSLREIARGLEERRRLTPRRSATWTPTTVRRLLARLEGGS